MKEDLSKKIKNLRLKSGLTQSELAERVQVSPSCIGMYEQGRREPSGQVLSKICNELNVTSDYMLDIEGNCFKTKDNDVGMMLDKFTRYIETEKNIMLNGKFMDKESKIKISNALRVAVAVVLSEYKNKK